MLDLSRPTMPSQPRLTRWWATEAPTMPPTPTMTTFALLGNSAIALNSELISIANLRLFARVRYAMIPNKREDFWFSTPWATLLSRARRVLSRQGHLGDDIPLAV